MKVFYEIGIRLYYVLALVMSLWDEKARKWIEGRRGWRKKLEGVFGPEDEVIWFHCASLGEFEQGRPMIEAVRRKVQDKKVLLTFFSPSGYEKRKDYEGVDYVCYLPLDTKRNARDFLQMVLVEKAFFVKYEFWGNFLKELKSRKSEVYLISGIFRKEQLFFKRYGGWYRSLLHCFKHLYVQDDESMFLLDGIGVKACSVVGDTRFDRVLDIAKEAKRIPCVEEFVRGSRVLIAGSSWEEDERVILALYRRDRSDLKLIIAPHEPGKENIDRLRNWFGEVLLMSELLEGVSIGRERVLLVDTIGHLSSMYRYGDFAFIGGGFGKGIHNVLEASVAGLPVLFGPKHERFKEALELRKLGGAFCVRSSDEAAMQLDLLMENESIFELAKENSKQYVKDKAGASKMLVAEVFHSS